MKNRLSILFFLAYFFSLSVVGQRNYGQEFVDLLHEGDYFGARDFKQKYGDSIPENDFIDVFAKYKIGLYMNQPDSAAFYLHKMIVNHEENLDRSKSNYYGELIGIYSTEQQFDKAIKLCKEIIAYLKRNPFNVKDKAYIKSEIKTTKAIRSSLIKKRKSEPRKKMIRINSDNECRIKLHNDSLAIRFDAEYNGQILKTWFDTGVSYYFVMEKEIADSIGVKIYDTKQDTIKQVNNIMMKAIEGILDSVRLGNVVLYNIPVMVFLEKMSARMPDSLMNKPDIRAKIESFFDNMQIIMGLPTMQLIGQFEFNWKDSVFSMPVKSKKENIIPDIYNLNNRLYMQINIENINFTGFTDTGDVESFIKIDSSFYEKNQSNLELDKEITKDTLNYYLASGLYMNVPYEVVKNAKISFNDKVIPNEAGDVIMLKCENFSKRFDGIIGVGFFRRLGGKTLFDFENMVIEME